MRTRQHRLSDHKQIRLELSNLTGKNITLVMQDNMTVLGKLLTLQDNQLVIENMRLKKITLNVNAIDELYYDTLE